MNYEVLVELKAFGNLNGLTGSIGKAEASAKSLEKALGGVGTSFGASFASAVDTAFSGMVTSAATAGVAVGGALAAGLGKTLKHGFHFAQYTEDLTNGIAGTMAMLGDVPFEKGLTQAAKSVENIRRAAMVLPGEFKDAANAFSYILPVGLTHGVDIARLEKLGAQSVAVAASLGVAQGVAGHELAALLEGRASSRMPLASKLGIHAKEWNQLPFDKRINEIEKKFGKMDPAMSAFAGSWSGLTSSAKDQARNLAKTFSDPLFSAVKGQLGQGLEWFGRNEDAIHAWAASLGESVRYAFDRGIAAIRHWYPIVRRFGGALYDRLRDAFERAAPFLDRGAHALERALQPENIDRLAHAAKTLAMIKLGVEAGRGAGGLLGGVGLAAGPAAIAIGAFGLAAYGAVHALTDGSSRFHGAAVHFAESIETHALSSMKNLEASTSRLQPALDALGTLFLSHLDSLAIEFDFFTKKLTEYTTTIGFLIDKVFGPKLNDTPWDPAEFRTQFNYGGSVKALDFSGDKSFEAEKKPSVHNTQITNHNTIHMTISGSGDPDRVARRAIDMIQDLARNPRTTRTQQAFSR